ncbi:MAG: sulfatase [Alistipes sp.]|nr:sulfatase [Alistipes sp.]
MKTSLRTAASLALATQLVGCSPESDRPNIVLFLIDDMGWADSSVAFGDDVYPRNLIFETPNMERLAAQGVTMSAAYVSSTSSPTRNSIMTGMNSARSRHTNYGAKFLDTPTDGGDKLEVLKDDVLVPTDWNYNGIDPTGTVPHAAHCTPFPQILKDNGYYTIHVGKGHWAPMGVPAASPLNMGFCVNVAGQIVGRANSYYGEDNYGNRSDIWSWHATHNMCEYYGTATHLSDALTLEALKTLDYPIDNNIPFYLNFCHHAVHTPIQGDKRFIDKYLAKGLDHQQAAYASLVEGIDKSLGELLDYLETKGVADNTLIIFLSDNGGDCIHPEKGGVKHTHNLPLRSGKGSVYEGGIRVPMIASWGSKSANGTKTTTPVVAEDIFATILDVAGVNDYMTVQTVDGQSFAELITGSSSMDYNRPILTHFPHQWRPEVNDDIDYMTALRCGDWKLVYRHRTLALELYNLATDLGEQHNLALSEPEQLRTLAEAMTAQLKAKGALLPTLRATGECIPYPDQLINQL